MNCLVSVITYAAAVLLGGFIFRNNPFKAKLTLDQLEAKYNAEVAKLEGGK